KGIADYADGSQLASESWSSCASVMAASLVTHMLNEPRVFHSWPHYQAWNVFPSLQNLQCDAEQVSKKTNLPSDLRTIAANKGFFVSDNQASGNCLFHALSEQLQSVKGIQISHKELRKTLVQFLDENPNLVS
ncbi:unnamed protein product, partial [Porites lobata]